MHMNIAICDDDHVVCSQIEHCLLVYGKETGKSISIDIFHDGRSLLNHIQFEHDNYDLIYLDIEMEEVNGVEVGVTIRNDIKDHKIQMVYISGKTQYDRQLFDVQPLSFIDKPIVHDKLIKSLELAIEKLGLIPKLFHYKKRKEYFNVPLEDIIVFENSGRNIIIHTVDKKDKFSGSLKSLAAELAGFGFIQVSQSIVVNFRFVSKYSREEIIMFNEEKFAIPKNKRTEVKERFLREIDKS